MEATTLNRHHPGAGLATGVAAFLFWGLVTIYWHELAHLRPIEVIGYRILLAAFVLAVALTVRRSWGRLRTIDASSRRFLLLSSAFLFCNWFSYVAAVSAGHVLEVALGYFLSPVMMVATGALLFGEQLGRAQKTAMALAGGAIVLLSIDYGRLPLYAVAIATTWAFYSFSRRRIDVPAIESLAAETFLVTPIAVLIAAFTASSPTSVPHGTTRTLVLFAFAGVVTVLPLALFTVAARSLTFTTLGLLNYIVPTINFALGAFAYDEPVSELKLSAFVLLWVGLAGVVVAAIRRQRSAAGVAASEPVPTS